jgi:hypothetical protein
VASTAVSTTNVAVVDPVRLLGLQCIAGIIMSHGHCLGVRPLSLERVLHTQFQPLGESICYANRILGQGNNSEREIVLTCIAVQYTYFSERLGDV